MTGQNFEAFKVTLPLAFFTWHDRLEANHRDHVWHELRACYDSPSFEDEAFIAAGVTMLDAVRTFWDGLYAMAPVLSSRGTGPRERRMAGAQRRDRVCLPGAP